MYVCVYIYIYIHISICMYVYIYIYIERERERYILAGLAGLPGLAAALRHYITLTSTNIYHSIQYYITSYRALSEDDLLQGRRQHGGHLGQREDLHR